MGRGVLQPLAIIGNIRNYGQYHTSLFAIFKDRASFESLVTVALNIQEEKLVYNRLANAYWRNDRGLSRAMLEFVIRPNTST